MTIELEARYQRGRGSVDEYLEQTAIANPHVTMHYTRSRGQSEDLPPLDDAVAARAEGDQAASVRHRIGPVGDDAQGDQSPDLVAVPVRFVLARQPGRGPADLRRRPRSARGRRPNGSAARRPMRCTRQSSETKIPAPATDCISPIGEELIAQGPAAGRARRVLLRGHAAAVGLSRQSVPDRSRPWPMAATTHVQKVSLEVLTELLARKRRPHVAAVHHQHVRRPGGRRGGPDSAGSQVRHPPIARQAQSRGHQAAARGHAKRESVRRADDAGAALCQPRAAAVQAAGLRDHARRSCRTNWRPYGLVPVARALPTRAR